MNISGQLIVVLVFAFIALVAVAVIAWMRYFIRWSGYKEVFKDGLVASESGVGYLRFAVAGLREVAYREIDSVELVPFYKFMLFGVFRYGSQARTLHGQQMFGDVLAIKLKHSDPARYIFVAPRDAATIYEQIKNKIQHETTVA
jgi:hypothetical protein